MSGRRTGAATRDRDPRLSVMYAGDGQPLAVPNRERVVGRCRSMTSWDALLDELIELAGRAKTTIGKLGIPTPGVRP